MVQAGQTESNFRDAGVLIRSPRRPAEGGDDPTAAKPAEDADPSLDDDGLLGLSASVVGDVMCCELHKEASNGDTEKPHSAEA